MKVPPKPPTYTKEKGLTRRTVKGAAGGMLGVHYEDTRHNDVNTVRAHTERASAGKGVNRDGSPAVDVDPVAGRSAAGAYGESEAKLRGPKEEQEMVLDDEDANTRDAKKRERQRFVARDRLTIDKDAPELRRTRDLWAKIMGDEEEEEDAPGESGARHAPDPEELDVEAIGEAIASAGDDAPVDRARFFSPAGRSRVGDPTLLDPETIRRAVRTPIAYAKHVMVLGEAFARSTGARREEVIGYMAAMYAAMPDRRFARQALKEFGPSTGILDVYPLEIVEDLVLRYPGCLPKVGFGALFARPSGDPNSPLELVEGRSSPITYPKNLKLRGFALKGGGDPGYVFEPDETPGTYRLRIDSPGRYTVMISAITRSGHAIIDRLRVNVRPAARRPRAAAAPRADRPSRDEAKVAAWPRPTVPPPDLSELLARASEQVQDSLLSMGELVSRRHRDSMRGPKGEVHADYGYRPEEPADGPASPPDPEAERRGLSMPAGAREPEPDAPLSNAEQAVLRLALATQITSDDLLAAPTLDTSEAALTTPEATEALTADDAPAPPEEPVTAHDAPAAPAEPVTAHEAFSEDDDLTAHDVPAAPPPEPVTAHDAPLAAPDEAADLEETAPLSRDLDASPAEATPGAEAPPPDPGPAPRSADADGAAQDEAGLFSAPLDELQAPPVPPPTPEEVPEQAPSRPTSAPPLQPSSPRPRRGTGPRPVAPSDERRAPSGARRAPSAPPRPSSAPARGPSGARPVVARASTPAGAPPVRRRSTPATRPPSAPKPETPVSEAPSAPPLETMVVRVRDPNPPQGPRAPEPLVIPPRDLTPSRPGLLVPLSSPMDEARPPSASGGFVAAQADLPPNAQGETDSEVPAYVPPPRGGDGSEQDGPLVSPPPSDQRAQVTEIVRARGAAPTPPPVPIVGSAVEDTPPAASTEGDDAEPSTEPAPPVGVPVDDLVLDVED